MERIGLPRKFPCILAVALLAVLTLAPAHAQSGFAIAQERPLLDTPQPTARTTREFSALPLLSSSATAACVVDPNRELFITDVSVVDDCWRTSWFGPCPVPTVAPATRGAWTFGKLVEGIFGTTSPTVLSNEVLGWLNEWAIFQTINGDPVPARPMIKPLVIDPWLAASGGTTLDMRLAPFRLLAIVSRLDLRQPGSAPGGRTAGEGRFVFNVLDAFGNPTEFLVILEYGLDAALCGDVLTWANRWHNLGTIPFGDPYNAELQRITDSFTAIGASPGKPNGSAINQVRSNDFFLASPWELREFGLRPATAGTAPLRMRTVAQTPAIGHQNTALLANYVNANTPAILANNYTVPLTFSGVPFRGGASPHSLNLNWDGPPPACTSIADPNARHIFSLNTCSGCHGAETGTVFKHVEPRLPGSPSVLSGFLTGTTLTDMCGISRSFNDLRRRQMDLCTLLASPCSSLALEEPITVVH